MSFQLTDFCRIRPYLYHLTSKRNLQGILDSGAIKCASHLFTLANKEELISVKRTRIIPIEVNGRVVDIRDQKPLYEGKASINDGWNFSDLIRALNERVFFWPGWGDKPIDYGVRHFELYKGSGTIVIRVRTSDLFAANTASPYFCKYNSGSPRTTRGKGSPRGKSTFVECENAPFVASQVVEVTFLGESRLPSGVQYSESLNGPWSDR